MIANRKVSSAQRGCISIVVMVAALLALPASGMAEVPAKVWQAPDDGLAGEGAGQLGGAGNIAADPNSGHVYVTDGANARVVEFDAWGQFVKAWGWGVANGASELQACGPGATPPTSTCQKGIGGGGVGQFNSLSGGIAVDSAGDIYVGDFQAGRIQKFDSSGKFLLVFGDGVNQGPNHPGDVCTAQHLAEGDNCGTGTQGDGPGQFVFVEKDSIDIDSTGTIFVGGRERIQEFNPDGTYKGEIKNQSLVCGTDFIACRVDALALDSVGNFHIIDWKYSTSNTLTTQVRKLSPSGELLRTYEVKGQVYGLAVDPNDNLFVSLLRIKEGQNIYEINEFDPSGQTLIGPDSGFKSADETLLFGSLATNTVTPDGGVSLYAARGSVGGGNLRSSVDAFGVPPIKWTPPQFAPEVASQYATSVEPDLAVLGAEINPRFWADTAYYVEYGTGKCSEGGCTAQEPSAPGLDLGAGAVGFAVKTKGLTITGLTPNTTYHYRFAAGSSGGGPVHGVGDGEAEGTFTTPSRVFPLSTSCPNQAFRSGPSAGLPDCRAYEMVSPVDKNNTDIRPLININSNAAALNVSAVDGGRLTYTTSQGFGDAQGVPYVVQYLASRGEGGWTNHGIVPPQGFSPVHISARIDAQFRAFTPDLCSGILQHFTTTGTPPAPGGVPGFTNLYKRDNCGPSEDSYEALTPTEPPNTSPPNFIPDARAVSADGRCTIVAASDQLTPEAAPGIPGVGSRFQLYESCGGVLRLVSVLPNGQATTTDAWLGTIDGATSDLRSGITAQATSADGSRIYWTEAGTGGSGRIYLRINADQEQSQIAGGQCSEEEKACTVRVSQTASSDPSHFWGASSDGAKAFFTNTAKQKLYAFELGGGSNLVAGEVLGVLGVGGDATRTYFLSQEALAGENAEGHSSIAGKPNLYLYETATEEDAESIDFIGTLSVADAAVSTTRAVTPANLEPYKKVAKLSPDGRNLVFMSNAPLTGYDNTDQVNGKADSEIFVYDALAEELNCVSCHPSGQRPRGRQIKIEGSFIPSSTWGAAVLSPYASALYAPRSLSDDGTRLFFDSFEGLVPRDTNGRTDVYEWEAPGAGDCDTGDANYFVQNRGCLSLISSGESPTDSEFIDASADGGEVFFTTGSSLLPQDPGLIDIYVARINGGYPQPPAPPAPCEGEACQGLPAPPNDPTPASSSFEGAGNVIEGKAKAKKHKKKKHASKGKKRQKRANENRRAGR